MKGVGSEHGYRHRIPVLLFFIILTSPVVNSTPQLSQDVGVSKGEGKLDSKITEV
jgi:hypothetical protein